MRNFALNSNDDKELKQSIQLYEEGKRNNHLPYLDVDQLSDIALKYMENNRHDEALEVLQYGLHLHRENTDLKLRLAYYYLDVMNFDKAEEVTEQITDLCNDEFKLLKAEIFLNKGLLHDAQQETDSIFDKNNPETVMNTIYLYLDMGYPAEAEKWLTHAKERFGMKDFCIEAEASYQIAIGNYEEAIQLYDKLLDNNPFDAIYWVGQAKCYIYLNNNGKALDACEFAIAADETYGEAYLLRANCYYNQNQLEKAIMDFEKAIQYKSFPLVNGLTMIGNLYWEQHEWEKAYDTYRRVLTLLAEKEVDFDTSQYTEPILISDIYTALSSVAYQLHKLDETFEYIRLSFMFNPNNKTAYYISASIFLSEDEVSKAFDILKKAAVKFDGMPNDVSDFQVWFTEGNEFLQQHKFMSAVKCFIQAYEIDPNHLENIQKLLLTFIRIKDTEDFTKLIELHPEIHLEDFVQFILNEDKEIDSTTRELFHSLINKNK